MSAGEPPAAPQTIGGGFYLAPPTASTAPPAPVPTGPSPRRPTALPAVDVRRLELHTALVTAGVPPRPGDTEAIRAVAQLDDATVHTVIGWLGAARR